MEFTNGKTWMSSKQIDEATLHVERTYDDNEAELHGKAEVVAASSINVKWSMLGGNHKEGLRTKPDDNWRQMVER
ncbi:hypothetical protein R1flu_004912 [Riccia fluitans]|uniref:Uncharacterized protein n=1 Tax=Riccia fluitans TaxID=41844 RepID=A0ABD1YRZ4_9MARC